MDPQQRLLLERGYAALHGAGRSRHELLNSVTAVSVGQWASEFGSLLMNSPAGRTVYASTGFACSVTCGRVSFVLERLLPRYWRDAALHGAQVGRLLRAQASARINKLTSSEGSDGFASPN